MNTARDAVVIAVAGLGILGFFGWPVLKAWQARFWPAVEGTVTSSNIVERSTGGDGEGRRFVVAVTYRYRVGTQDREGRRIGFFSNHRHRSRGPAQAKLRKYPHGSRLPVHYDPRDPARAVIDTGVPWAHYFAVAIGAVFLLGGLAGLMRLAM